MGAQHSVQVADAGSSPVGSILPFVVEKFVRGENAEIISSSNLTQDIRGPILIMDRVLRTTDLTDGSAFAEPLPFSRAT